MFELRKFTAVYGLTLTVDGKLFPDGPDQAYSYVMDERCISRLVRELKRRGYLHTGRYFWVVEWQEETQQAHWHLLLDASFVPYGEVVELWSRNRPEWAPKIERITAENYKGHAPAFGSVRYSFSGNAEKAGFYASKYLTKYPVAGYPEWVMQHVGRVPKYGHSNKFFPTKTGHDDGCFCEECRGEESALEAAAMARREARRLKKIQADQEENPLPPRRANQLLTVGERVAVCEKISSLVEVTKRMAPDGQIHIRRKYLGPLKLTLEKCHEFVGEEFSGQDFLELQGDEFNRLLEFEATGKDSSYGGENWWD